MRVQIVAHHPPWRRCTARGEQVFEEVDVVFFSARAADGAVYLAGGDVERRDQTLGAMALVFVFPPLDLAWLHGQARRGTFQGLHAAHFVDRHRADALFRCVRRCHVDRADLSAFRLEVRIGLGRQPPPHAMWPKRGLF